METRPDDTGPETTAMAAEPSWSGSDGSLTGGMRRGASSPTLPFILGPYELRELLGVGGMGIVYRAEQTTPMHREVAIKLIRAEAASLHVIARFEAERETLARMDHPHIARILDAGDSVHGPYFVMDLVRGVPVTDSRWASSSTSCSPGRGRARCAPGRPPSSTSSSWERRSARRRRSRVDRRRRPSSERAPTWTRSRSRRSRSNPTGAISRSSSSPRMCGAISMACPCWRARPRGAIGPASSCGVTARRSWPRPPRPCCSWR